MPEWCRNSDADRSPTHLGPPIGTTHALDGRPFHERILSTGKYMDDVHSVLVAARPER
jgi:hypothetical protein